MRVFLVLSTLLLFGCQPRVALMPTPDALRNPDFNLFEIRPEPLASNVISVLYATTRVPASNGSKLFTANKDSVTHLGFANVMVGNEDIALTKLIEQSTTEDRSRKFFISIAEAPIIWSAPLAEQGGNLEVSSELRQAFDRLNSHLRNMPMQELTIFVHGANNSFYRAIALGSMFQYFSGNNAPVLSYAWPSKGNLLRYTADKKTANQSAADFAQFIELLAEFTIATRINILAYSAGGRVAGGALAQLGERWQDPNALRLGQVYFAQSDQSTAEFFNELPVYFDLLEGITVTAAPGDKVLNFASRMTDGENRIGAVSEKSEPDLDISSDVASQLKKIINSERMVFIDLSNVPAPGYRFTHGAWYDSPWVSTDVMLTFLGGLTTGIERGLEPIELPDVTVWRFPPDYMEQLNTRLSEWRRVEDQGSQPQ